MSNIKIMQTNSDFTLKIFKNVLPLGSRNTVKRLL